MARFYYTIQIGHSQFGQAFLGLFQSVVNGYKFESAHIVQIGGGHHAAKN